ncbi:MAG TPA: SUMF1/EgtB/PvdO family nonheme iron enzyme [Cyclobacteriaceae bacterium]|jgi:formylglycine-generating enzyme required for sulfatase activity|nr:SUMF1/EgtB/PvdO family nonheme iron enzyme [Cytophagales bacterium]HMR58197.1 SUMF1/EgtB/PvdO family nonheme iron enzyme [Cyclobacteriaceae bacterium]HNT49386.1 SUMF1/EgtB/PvdO family nonheme iron enzyme [Cyclobacteriaceae bacterium]HRE65869.1 SUMF1/EgtB/PvdO family nonheme iron enzyme [Cyclobacteriaceae bacterium]HRF33713.1 SUMF1/EgtB/PvdO family nonheme iron enzyme [Cyclobacteriaceae bacterium]
MKHFFFIILLSFTVHLYGQDLKPYQQKIEGTSVTFKMVAIPAGKFKIGSPITERGRQEDEGPQKEIALSAFWMAEHEVTFAEWDLYFKDNALPQSKTIDGVTRATPQYIDLTWGMGRDAKHPTNSMSHTAAMMYCKWLYTKTGFFYRLPTEAEWEYACRAGSNTTYPFGNDAAALREFGYFKDNSGAKFHHVAQLKPNAWGLYDMLGNLSEWTIDQYDASFYSKASDKNPATVPASKHPKTVKGGSYLDEASELRCANRMASNSNWNIRDPQIPKSKWWLTDGMFVGFRVVRPLVQPSKEEIEKFYNLYLK